MKRIGQIFEGIEYEEIKGDPEIVVSCVEQDSRVAGPGCMFFAVKGLVTDGHDHIGKAVASGASAVVCEKLPTALSSGVCYVLVKDTAAALGRAASAFYGYPSRKLRLIGITGTNGKTTTATLLFRLFREAGYSAGLISTVTYQVNDRKLPATHTTPDQIALNRLLAGMVDEGCEYCFMEVSSHSVVQQRIGGLHFTGGVFTNLSRDHLDYHKSYDEYLRAKKSFFDILGSDAFALINADDRNGRVMVQNTSAAVSSYAFKSMADFRGKIIERHHSGMHLNFAGRELWTCFIGDFNAYNLLAVYATAVLLDAGEEEALRIISSLTPVEGRFETIRSDSGVTAVVDYAHTPDALENVIMTVRQLMGEGARLITVAGAGGDRDRGKRPVMAKIASINSDTLVLTSDNPRSEDPASIINDMLTGVDESNRERVLCIGDRREAIRTACLMARTGDFVLVAGKGHETYQEIRGVRHHFDDREVVRSVFGQVH